MKAFPTTNPGPKRGGRLACLIVVVLAAVTASDALAQKKGGVRRPRDSKDELMERAKQLQEKLPALKDAALSDDDKVREDARRQALEILDTAVSSDMQKKLGEESKRLSDGKQTPAAEKVELGKRIADQLRKEAPADARKLLDQAPKAAQDALGGLADDAAEEESAADVPEGTLVEAADGGTIRVPNIQVAMQFTGKVVPVEGNGPAPGPKPAPKEKRKSKEEKAAELNTMEIDCEGSAVFSGQPDGPKEGRVIIFKDNVRVKKGNTTIRGDVLTVYMDPEEPGEGKPKEAGDFAGGKVNHAVVTGSEVMIRQEQNGKVRIAKARKATYLNNGVDGGNGDVVLEDYPQVQDEKNWIVAKERSTVITLPGNQEKEAVVAGPATYKIVPKSGEGDGLLPK